jgi:hypothetical protein
MAAATLPAPGTEFGPCPSDPGCAHTDCAASRTQAATPCGICGAPIGYDVRFYNDDERGLVHALCLEASYEGRP